MKNLIIFCCIEWQNGTYKEHKSIKNKRMPLIQRVSNTELLRRLQKEREVLKLLPQETNMKYKDSSCKKSLWVKGW